MSKTLKRVLFALSLSLTGFALTFTWYNFTEKNDSTTSSAKPVARLVSILNDVQKKMNQKIIWQSEKENEILRLGEAIRTSPDSEARIVFYNSQTAIDLEPDSAIVLNEHNGGVSLNFIKGNILIKSDESLALSENNAKTETKITLKHGNQDVDLKNSKIAIGKNTSGDLDVQVMSGAANQLSALNNNDGLQVFRPLPGENIYISPSQKDPIVFNWKPLPNTYKVTLYSGDKRSSMTQVTDAFASGETGEIKLLIQNNKLSFGKNYFQLVSETIDDSIKKIESSVFRVQIFAKIPPQLLSPTPNQLFALTKKTQSLHFIWSNISNFSKSIIEIATTPDLKKPILLEYLNDTNEYTLTNVNEGTYY